MSQHVYSVCRTGYYYTRNTGGIRRYLTIDTAKTLVHALVTSRLDHGSSLLHGLHANHLAKMQRLQNACARVITRTGRRSHISPVLKELHWPPVRHRIQCKILSHTYINRFNSILYLFLLFILFYVMNPSSYYFNPTPFLIFTVPIIVWFFVWLIT